MCDYFEDDFDDFMDEESFEDQYEEDTEMDDPFDCESELDDEPKQAESTDDFTAKDAFIAGSFAGWTYEEGLREKIRRKLKRIRDDDG